MIWSEDFQSYPAGTTQGNGVPPKWIIDVTDCDLTHQNDWFEVKTVSTSNRMEGAGLDGEAIWTSQAINISGYTNVNLLVELAETGTMESSDYIRVYYKIDGGPETLFETNGDKSDNFGSATASQTGLNGTNVVLVIKVKNSALSEKHRFDNVWVEGTLPQQYTLMVNTSGNGSVSLVPPGGSYLEKTIVQLTANPAPGWSFSGWSSDLSGSENPKDINMDDDKTVLANFIAQTIALDVPNGGQLWGAGEPRFIRWHGSTPPSSPVKIEYSTNGSTTWSLVTANTPNNGSYQWTVPATPSNQCRVKISDAVAGTPVDISDNDFTIFTQIAVDVPNGGELWGAGEPRFIRWHGSTPPSSPVKIEYSTNGGTTWSLVTANTPNNGSYQWTVPATPSTECRVKISDATAGTPVDISDNDFTIFTQIAVDVPNGGEAWEAGEPRFIRWHGSTPPSSPVKIEYSTNGGTTWSLVTAGTPNNGSYQWTVPATPSNQCRVKISDAAAGTPLDMSNANFTISIQPIADFNTAPVQGISPLTVQFENLSQHADQWLWNFGDGSPVSTEKNPAHQYVYADCAPATEKFTVTLSAINSSGSDTEQKIDFVTVYSPSAADFEADIVKICSGAEVMLLNKTCGAAAVWELNWGDGTVEIGPFPITEWKHTYTTLLPTETFTVTLAVDGKGGTDTEIKTDYITVHGPVVADFSANVTNGIAPMEVQLSDISQGWVTAWLWDLGDGHTSTEQNPVHVYNGDPKHVTITLTVSGPCENGVLVKNVNYLTVNKAVQVSFNAAPIVGVPGLEVQFTNNAGGNANHFLWDYGDGHNEQLQHDMMHKTHPTHIYENTGEYAVSLKGWGHGGDDAFVVNNLIYVDPNFVAMEFVEGSETLPGESWDNAMNHDIITSNANAVALNNDAYAIFRRVDDDSPILFDKVRLLSNNGLGTRYNNHLIKEFELWFSMDNVTYEKVMSGTLTRGDMWKIFEFTPKAGQYVKLMVKSAQGDGSPYATLGEIQFFGAPPAALALLKDVDGLDVLDWEPVTEFRLENAYPNPFNPNTSLQFALPTDEKVQLEVYNIRGQLVSTILNCDVPAGRYTYRFDAGQLNSGIYFYRFRAGKFQQIKRMTFLK